MRKNMLLCYSGFSAPSFTTPTFSHYTLASLAIHLSELPYAQLHPALWPLYLSFFLALWNEFLIFHVSAHPHLLREVFLATI